MFKLEVICDNTELQALWNSDVPDIIVIGGYAIPGENVNPLITAIRRRKEELLGDDQIPVKWNIKDLGRALNAHGLDNLLPTLKSNSELIRSDLLRLLRESGATMFVSVVLAHSTKKDKIPKMELAGYSFSNLLMRVGLFKKSLKNASDCELILDWPDGHQREPFIKEYRLGWKSGKSGNNQKEISFFCGPLKNLGFHASPLFGITDFDERLQLADLLVGCSRSFINYCMDKTTEKDFGVQEFNKLLPSLYKDPKGKVLGCGLSISPLNSTLGKMIKAKLNNV